MADTWRMLLGCCFCVIKTLEDQVLVHYSPVYRFFFFFSLWACYQRRWGSAMYGVLWGLFLSLLGTVLSSTGNCQSDVAFPVNYPYKR